MKKTAVWMVVVAILCFAPSLAMAASPWTQESTYMGKLKGKLDFGFKNTLGGWTEILTEPYDRRENWGGLATGVGVGIWNAAVDTVGGLLHLATFPFTTLDIPLPQDGVQF